MLQRYAVLLACLLAGNARAGRARPPRPVYTPEAEADRVTDLPGRNGPVDFGLFAGYVTVSPLAGRALYYIFAEAKAGAAQAPLVLWLNGGPGCSSVGGGFMSELGPFFPTSAGKLVRNPWAWNDVANMLWLDSPAFVGWSYSNVSSDTIVGDERTARDARVFLIRWLERFPQFNSSIFYISGESYAGHYVPNLAWSILEGNHRFAAAQQQAQQGAEVDGYVEGRINLRGLFVGNAWTDAGVDNKGALDFWYTHAGIGLDAYHGILRHCNFSTVGPLMAAARSRAVQGGRSSNGAPPADCDGWVDRAMQQLGNINIYEIYADVCLQGDEMAQEGPRAASRRSLHTWGGAADATRQPSSPSTYRGALLGDQPAWAVPRPGATLRGLAAKGALGKPVPYDPCVDSAVDLYLNRPDVQAALHANVSGALPGPWSDCNRRIVYSREDLLTSILPVWKRLLGEGTLKLWVYSGDVDGIVPVLGSRRWVEAFKLPERQPWRSWTSSTGQVAGWRIDYEGLTFATVRGAGHMVPYVQPERAYALFGAFLYEDGPAPSGSR